MTMIQPLTKKKNRQDNFQGITFLFFGVKVASGMRLLLIYFLRLFERAQINVTH